MQLLFSNQFIQIHGVPVPHPIMSSSGGWSYLVDNISDLLPAVGGVGTFFFVGEARICPLIPLKGYTHKLKPRLPSMLYHLAPNFLSGHSEPLWCSWQATLLHTSCFFLLLLLALAVSLTNPRNYSLPIATNCLFGSPTTFPWQYPLLFCTWLCCCHILLGCLLFEGKDNILFVFFFPEPNTVPQSSECLTNAFK